MNSEAIFNAAHSTAIQLIESGAFISPADTVCALQTASGKIFTGISRSDMNSSVHAEVDAVRNMLAAGEKIVQAILLISTTGRMPLLPCNHCVGYILSLAPENSGCVVMMQDRVINLPEVARYAAPAGATSDLRQFRPPVGATSELRQFGAPMGATSELRQFGAPMGATSELRQFGAPMGATSELRQYGAPMGATSELRQYGAPMGATSELRPFMGQPVNVKPFVPPVQEQPDNEDDDQEEIKANTSNANGNLLKNKVQNIMNVTKDDDDDEFLDSLTPKKKRFGFLKK